MHVLLAAIIFFCAGLHGPAAPAGSILGDLPTGTLATGHVEPVSQGSLYVGVVDIVLPPGGAANVGGPPGFIVTEDGTLSIVGIPGAPGGLKLAPGAATFVAGGGSYKVQNTSGAPLRFRFIGLGARGQVKGARYEMEPIPWGPEAGRAYDVAVDRGPFSANSETAWHGHTGPAFGVLDGGTWENRQVTGQTRRIQTPGYYVQPANAVHQLAQVGSGGVALIVQFSPPGKPRTYGAPGRADRTPVVLTGLTTPFPAPTQPPVPTFTRPAPQATPTRPAIPSLLPATATLTAPPSLTPTGITSPTGTSPPLTATASATLVPPSETVTSTRPPTYTPVPTPTENLVPNATREVAPTATPVPLPAATVMPTPTPALFSGASGGLMTLLAVVVAGGLVAGVSWLTRRK